MEDAASSEGRTQIEGLTTRALAAPAFVGYLASRAAGSRPTLRSALETVARLCGAPSASACPWHLLRYSHLAALRSMLVALYAPATASRHLAAVRGVCRHAARLGLMSRDDLAGLLDVEPVKGSRLLRGRALAQGEIRALFSACDSSPRGARDAALIALLYGCGLRRAEAAGLDLGSVSVDAVRVIGKGNKERIVPLPDGARRALEAYLAVRGSEKGPLLVPTNAAGVLQLGRRWWAENVRLRMRALARLAGVAACSPHDLRRSFVGDLLDAGADLATVQALAGHAQPGTTSRYDRRGERAARKAQALLCVPFAGVSEN